MSSSSLLKISKLVAVLKKAQQAADQFKDHQDEGSANLDSVTITLKHWTEDSVNTVSNQSGIRIGRKLGSSMWRNSRFVHFDTHGARARNTFACEAACKVLQEEGYEASVYYKMD